jgi:peptidoglycan/LPS O-acetylase OafA/YrhL
MREPALASHASRIDGIDQLRAWAMLAVVTQHCGLLPMGWTGVWLFYVISGYVITAGILRRTPQGGGFGAQYWAFMAMRLSRIVPALLGYLLLCGLALALAGQAAAFWQHAPAVGAFVFNWWMIFAPEGGLPVPSPLGHLWTISVEQQFYLLFPLLALGLPERWRVPACWALVVLGPVARALTSAAYQAADPGGEHAFAIYASTHGHVDAFAAGALIAYHRGLGNWHANQAARRCAWVGAALLGLYVAYYGWVNLSQGAQGLQAWRNLVSGILWGQGREVWVYGPVVMLCAALVIWQSGAGASAAASPWGRALAWTGRMSYSGYLVHTLVIWALRPLWGAPASLRDLPPLSWALFYAAVLAGTLLLGHGLAVLVERPGQRWLRARLMPAANRPA